MGTSQVDRVLDVLERAGISVLLDAECGHDRWVLELGLFAGVQIAEQFKGSRRSTGLT